MQSTINDSSLPPCLFPGRKASRPAVNLRTAPARRCAWLVEAKGGGTTGPSRGRGIRKIWRCQQGVAAVEFALALPLLLMLIFGLIDFGLAMYAKGLITNASQEGARFGAIYRLDSLSGG